MHSENIRRLSIFFGATGVVGLGYLMGNLAAPQQAPRQRITPKRPLASSFFDPKNQLVSFNRSKQNIAQRNETTLISSNLPDLALNTLLYQTPDLTAKSSDADELLRTKVNWRTPKHLHLGTVPAACEPTVRELYETVRAPLYKSEQVPELSFQPVRTFVLDASKRDQMNKTLVELEKRGKIVNYIDMSAAGGSVGALDLSNFDLEGYEYVIAPLRWKDAKIVSQWAGYGKFGLSYVQHCIGSKYLTGLGLYLNKYGTGTDLELVAAVLEHVGDFAIGALAVRDEERRKGIATLMITKIANRMFDKGMTQVRANVKAGNKASESTFAKCGFEPSHESFAAADMQALALG